mmetsp:Transcript_34080/g.108300  ORF Transcript_34080/g.108300 Transcript_34080/m.108300 type:complete len:203 (-) Transcript_34080:111-719(-)
MLASVSRGTGRRRRLPNGSAILELAAHLDHHGPPPTSSPQRSLVTSSKGSPTTRPGLSEGALRRSHTRTRSSPKKVSLHRGRSPSALGARSTQPSVGLQVASTMHSYPEAFPFMLHRPHGSTSQLTSPSQGTKEVKVPLKWTPIIATSSDTPGRRGRPRRPPPAVMATSALPSNALHCSQNHRSGKVPPQFFSEYEGASTNS